MTIKQKQVVEDIWDLWGDSKVLVLKCDVSGTSDIHFSLVFSSVSSFNVINGLVLEVRVEDVIVI